MIFYKMDVEEELRKHGYNSYRLKKDNLLPATTLTRIKNGENIRHREPVLHVTPNCMLSGNCTSRLKVLARLLSRSRVSLLA